MNNVNISGDAPSKGESKLVDTKTAGWRHRAGGLVTSWGRVGSL